MKVFLNKIGFFVIFLLSVSHVMGNAQDYEVKSFEQVVTDLTGWSSETSRVGADGKMCAVLKVQANDRLKEAQGNVIGDLVRKGLETWIYLSDGTKQVQLYFDKHLPLTIKCEDFKYPKFSEKLTYVVKLEEKENDFAGNPKDGNNSINELVRLLTQANDKVSMLEKQLDEANTKIKRLEAVPVPKYTDEKGDELVNRLAKSSDTINELENMLASTKKELADVKESKYAIRPKYTDEEGDILVRRLNAAENKIKVLQQQLDACLSRTQ